MMLKMIEAVIIKLMTVIMNHLMLIMSMMMKRGRRRKTRGMNRIPLSLSWSCKKNAFG